MHLSLAHVISHTRRIAQLLSQLSIAGQPQLFMAVARTSDHMVRCLELLQRATTPRVSHFSASLVFGLHTGCSEDYNDHCTTVWTFLESCTLRCVVGSIFLPMYMHFLAKKNSKMFTCLICWLALIHTWCPFYVSH